MFLPISLSSFFKNIWSICCKYSNFLQHNTIKRQLFSLYAIILDLSKSSANYDIIVESSHFSNVTVTCNSLHHKPLSVTLVFAIPTTKLVLANACPAVKEKNKKIETNQNESKRMLIRSFVRSSQPDIFRQQPPFRKTHNRRNPLIISALQDSRCYHPSQPHLSHYQQHPFRATAVAHIFDGRRKYLRRPSHQAAQPTLDG
jgi:hypothetical protein